MSVASGLGVVSAVVCCPPMSTVTPCSGGRAQVQALLARVQPLPGDLHQQRQLHVVMRRPDVLDPDDLPSPLVHDLHGPRPRGRGHLPHERGHPTPALVTPTGPSPLVTDPTPRHLLKVARVRPGAGRAVHMRWSRSQ